ncbi:MAG: chemotaxis protein CheA [Nitrospirae bacterium]|nr:chemotaxis protein CheA [Nitrospirota bacterium]
MPEETTDMDFKIFLHEYLDDAKEGFQKANTALLEFEKDYSHKERLDELMRVFHTLKSSSAMLDFKDIAELAHAVENLVDRIKKGEVLVSQGSLDIVFEGVDILEKMMLIKEKGTGENESLLGQQVAELWNKITESEKESSNTIAAKQQASVHGSVRSIPLIEKIEKVKVDVKLLDDLFNLVGEIIINKNRVNNLISGSVNKELKATLADQDRKINQLREFVSSARMVTVDEILQKFPRMVRDLARAQNKDIEMVIEGREIEIDKSVLDSITEPLLHLLRNSVDHGIETREERQKGNKKIRGTIKLACRRTENNIVIDVEDDGKGIDIDNIRDIALTRGIIQKDDLEVLEDKDIINILFKPGFSTSAEITGLSGRGVGLNVVKTVARELGGIVEVATEKEKGTRFSLTLPVTTTVVRTLIIGVDGHSYAIPASIVLEILKVDSTSIKDVGDGRVFMRGEEVLPYVWLGKVLGLSDFKEGELTIVLIQRGDSFTGLGVDIVIDQMDSIVKPLDRLARDFRGFSGGIVLGDGSVVLLLDIPTLLNFKTVQKERFVI